MDNARIGQYLVGSVSVAILALGLCRAGTLPRICSKIRWHFWLFLVLSVCASVAAAVGFAFLLQPGNPSKTDYSAILNVLSLLSAGAIAGFFAFSYQDAAEGEDLLPNLVSISFSLILVFLFGSVCFFLGQNGMFINDATVNLVLPAIMGMILVGNVFYDFYDYVTIEDDGEEEEE